MDTLYPILLPGVFNFSTDGELVKWCLAIFPRIKGGKNISLFIVFLVLFGGVDYKSLRSTIISDLCVELNVYASNHQTGEGVCRSSSHVRNRVRRYWADRIDFRTSGALSRPCVMNSFHCVLHTHTHTREGLKGQKMQRDERGERCDAAMGLMKCREGLNERMRTAHIQVSVRRRRIISNDRLG